MSGSGVMRELNRSQKADVGYHNASAALQNERLTRERVERLETHARVADRRIDVLELARNAFDERGFWGRLRWLLLGR